jgi:hypothetical protein
MNLRWGTVHPCLSKYFDDSIAYGSTVPVNPRAPAKGAPTFFVKRLLRDYCKLTVPFNRINLEELPIITSNTPGSKTQPPCLSS